MDNLSSINRTGRPIDIKPVKKIVRRRGSDFVDGVEPADEGDPAARESFRPEEKGNHVDVYV
jgi:hypothetical protein